jgi:hypothetical protein
MEVHQTEFLQAVVLAGAVALGMTVWEESREATRSTAADTTLRTVAPQYQSVKNSHVVQAAHKREVQR